MTSETTARETLRTIETQTLVTVVKQMTFAGIKSRDLTSLHAAVESYTECYVWFSAVYDAIEDAKESGLIAWTNSEWGYACVPDSYVSDVLETLNRLSGTKRENVSRSRLRAELESAGWDGVPHLFLVAALGRLTEAGKAIETNENGLILYRRAPRQSTTKRLTIAEAKKIQQLTREGHVYACRYNRQRKFIRWVHNCCDTRFVIEFTDGDVAERWNAVTVKK